MRKSKSNLHFILIMILTITLSLAGCSADSEEAAVYSGVIYNSNDGNCGTSGESFEFYFDDELIATVASGASQAVEIEGGTYTVKINFTDDGTPYATDEDVIIDKDNWGYWAGCDDGTRPVSGKIYNSNDGDCEYSGESFDYYINDTLVATVGPGENISVAILRGTYEVDIYVTSDQTLAFNIPEKIINDDGWTLVAGCDDGTKP